ncbi:MAG: helix-turn-helix domain-containing protein [Clostridia bacterium]|nr:helix-turn-helix domain-containing protein [Clostridia bacterium]
MDISLYKKILKERKMTYEDLAEQTGLSTGCIKRIMAGIARYPRIDTIEAIDRVLLKNDGITKEERDAGLSLTKKISITPIEDEMLYVFRAVGEKYGEEAQRSIIELSKNILNVK